MIDSYMERWPCYIDKGGKSCRIVVIVKGNVISMCRFLHALIKLLKDARQTVSSGNLQEVDLGLK